MSATSPANAKPTAARGLRERFVDFVNPKLKTYNKPVLLALVVGVLTVLVTVILYVTMVNDCSVASFTGSQIEIFNFVNNEAPSCVCGTYEQTIKSTMDLEDQYTSMDSCRWTAGDWDVNYGGIGSRSEFEWCSDCENPLNQLNPYYDPESSIDDDYFNGEYTYPECSFIMSSTGMLQYEVCPDPLATIGAALGYAAYVELVFTVIVVFILSNCGVINADNGFLKELVAQVVEGKDTAKELAEIA